MSSNSEIVVRCECEQIEVTRDGTFPPYIPDYARKFIPGPATFYVTVDGVELPPMTRDQYKAWKESNEQLQRRP